MGPSSHEVTHNITRVDGRRATCTHTVATVLLFCSIYHKLCVAAASVAEYFGGNLLSNANVSGR